MVQFRQVIFGWLRVLLIFLLPVLVCSCTLPRADIESGVKPNIKDGTTTKGAYDVKSGLETGKKTAVAPISGLRLIGEVEPVTLVKAGLTMSARIDTGATTSSLDATEIRRFERDGQRWVRFMVIDRRNGEKKEMKCPFSRNVIIKRHGEKSLKRPVVKVKSMMGGVRLVREFSLTNRSDFKYPILIGRNFLQGEFVVDVNRKNVTTPMSEKQR